MNSISTAGAIVGRSDLSGSQPLAKSIGAEEENGDDIFTLFNLPREKIILGTLLLFYFQF
jgi:hypothetical protein